MIKKLLFVVLFMSFFIGKAQVDPLQTKDSLAQVQWVDSIMSKMSVEEKIGQLFMVAAYSNKGEAHKAFITELIEQYHIGSLIFFQDNPLKQAELTNFYQSKSKYPLLIGIDGEWGLNMRLKDTYRYPWNMTLGAIRNNNLIEEFGKSVGKHCNRLGIHMNFAPVVDVNTNPDNPIIGNRSFGENHINVANKSVAFTKGLQSKSVLASAKHFPGHGDTSTDSHHTLPVVDFSKKRLDSIELYPYKKNFEAGLMGVMVAHLSVPSLETNVELPSSLSKNIVTNLLKEKLGFKGLIITDAMNMKASANYASSEEINLAAILAGNDILDVPLNIPETVIRFKEALKTGELTEARLDESVRKILMTKYWAGLNTYKPIELTNLGNDLNTIENDLLHRKLVENSITLVKNKDLVFPIQNLDKKKVAYVKLGDDFGGPFLSTLQKYTQVDYITSKNLNDLVKKLKPYNLVIVGFHKSNLNPWKSYKFKEHELVWLQEIARQKTIILDVFTSPYSLLQIKTFENIEGLVVSYQNSKLSQEISAQMMFGALETKGKLPVSIKNVFSEGHGLMSSSLNRLAYSVPEEVGLSSTKLKQIDSVAHVVLKEKMAPGMQVLVARKGKVVYQKSFGHHTDEEKRQVKNEHLYDVASLTKILASLPLVMELEETGELNLETELQELLPELKGTNKDTLTIKEILSHVGQLKAWIPFYQFTLDSLSLKPSKEFYTKRKTLDFGVQITDALYLKNNYKKIMYDSIYVAKQRERIGYKYSDIPYYLLKKYIENHYQKDLDQLTKSHFYNSLGANFTTYLPLKKFSKKSIVPTEKDEYWRNELVHGTVHDMGAAMLGGIAGHAGLFSNANDIAKIMQLYLQKGYYGGKRYFKATTFDKFNYRYYAQDSVRRGVGFDKPQLRAVEKATCNCVSDLSFGHSGFTGTYTWADPETELIYVFLSNRVYPNMENKGLVQENIRTEIQRIIQEAIIE
jgi:beta-glucosidase-like glycosyl hydrolase/CubicO group peptidase (beta-lactamase class C family)